MELKEKLTAQSMLETRFAHEFLIDLDATKAARRAGYSSKSYQSLKVQGCRTLARPRVQAIIAKLQAARLKRVLFDQDDVLRELGQICFADPLDMFDESGVLIPLHKWPEGLRRAVQAIDVFKFNAQGVPTDFRVRLWDKNKALDKYGHHLGMFGDKDVGKKPDAGQIEKRWTMEFIDAKPDAKLAALSAPKPDKPNGGMTNGN